MIEPARPRSACIAIGFAILAAIGCRSNDAGPTPTVATPPATAAHVDPWASRPQRALPPPEITDPFQRPMFWAATRGGKTTYLFGTLHGGVDAERRIPRWVWDHFDAAPTLVLETTLQDVELARWTIRPEGKPLREELGEDYWKIFESVVTPAAAMFLDHQATAAAALRTTGHGGGGLDQTVPMDGALLVRAQGLKKQIVFLETAAFQGNLFVELFGLAALKRLLDRRDELPALNHGFFDAYLEGDETRLHTIGRAQFRLGAADDDELARVIDILLVSRNRSWIPQLEQVHATGGAFVAVGALHLAGEHNVLDLLRARGFDITRPAAR